MSGSGEPPDKGVQGELTPEQQQRELALKQQQQERELALKQQQQQQQELSQKNQQVPPPSGGMGNQPSQGQNQEQLYEELLKESEAASAKSQPGKSSLDAAKQEKLWELLKNKVPFPAKYSANPDLLEAMAKLNVTVEPQKPDNPEGPLQNLGGNRESNKPRPKRQTSRESGQMDVDEDDRDLNPTGPNAETVQFEKRLDFNSTHGRLAPGLTPDQLQEANSRGRLVLTPVDLCFMYLSSAGNWLYSNHIKWDRINNEKIGDQWRYMQVPQPVRTTDVFLLKDVLKYLKGRQVILSRMPKSSRSNWDGTELENAEILIEHLPAYIKFTKEYKGITDPQKQAQFFSGKKGYGGTDYRQLWVHNISGPLYWVQKSAVMRREQLNYGFRTEYTTTAFQQSVHYVKEAGNGQDVSDSDPFNQEDVLIIEHDDFTQKIDHTSSVGKLPENFEKISKEQRWFASFKQDVKAYIGDDTVEDIFIRRLHNAKPTTQTFTFLLYVVQEHFCTNIEKLAYEMTTQRSYTDPVPGVEFNIGYPEPTPEQKAVQQAARQARPTEHQQPRVVPRFMGYSVSGYHLMSQGDTMPATSGLQRAYIFWTNLVYLRRTRFENPPDDLTSGIAKKLVLRVNIMTEMVMAQFRNAKITFREHREPQDLSLGDSLAQQRVEDKLMELENQLSSGQLTDLVFYEEEQERIKKAGTAPPPQEAPVHQLQDLLSRVKLEDEVQLMEGIDLQPNRPMSDDGLLSEDNRAFHQILIALIEHYHANFPGRMQEYQNTILQEIQEVRPNAPIANILSVYKTLSTAQKGATWQATYAEGKMKRSRHGNLLYTFLFNFANANSDAGDLLRDPQQLDLVLKEIIVAGVRGINTATRTPAKAMDKSKEKASQPKPQTQLPQEPEIEYYGEVTDPAFNPNQGFGRRPKRLPLLMNHATESQPPEKIVPYDTSDDIKAHPTVDLFYRSTTDNAYKTHPMQREKGYTLFGKQYQQHYHTKPLGSDYQKGFLDRMEHYIYDQATPMTDPVPDLGNVCTGGYVQFNPEPDHKQWQFFNMKNHTLNSYFAALTGYIETHKVTSFMVNYSMLCNLRGKIQPCSDEGLYHHWCVYNAQGKRNMPERVPVDIYLTSAYHIRVMWCRDFRSGALYNAGYFECPDSEVCAFAVTNLLGHFYTTPLAAWQFEILPRKPGTTGIQFPEVLKQLPPGLYEYIVGQSSLLAGTSIVDLYRFKQDPYYYTTTSSPVMGFQGALTKAEILYGIPLEKIIKMPRFLLHYMECYILDTVYFYDRTSGQLQSPHALPGPLNRLHAVKRRSADPNFATPLGITAQEANFMINWLELTGYVVGGSKAAVRKINEPDSKVPPFVKEDLELYHKKLRDIVGNYYLQNQALGDVVSSSVYPVPPEVLFLQIRSARLFTGQDIILDSVNMNVKWEYDEKDTKITEQVSFRLPLNIVDNYWLPAQANQRYSKTIQVGWHWLKKPYDRFQSFLHQHRLVTALKNGQDSQEGCCAVGAVPPTYRNAPYSDVKTWDSMMDFSLWDIYLGISLKYLDVDLLRPVWKYISESGKRGRQGEGQNDNPDPPSGPDSGPNNKKPRTNTDPKPQSDPQSGRTYSQVTQQPSQQPPGSAQRPKGNFQQGTGQRQSSGNPKGRYRGNKPRKSLKFLRRNQAQAMREAPK